MTATAWYALQVRPRRESNVAELLRTKGYEILAPVYQSRRQWSDRTKDIEAPLFPGYLFCHFDPNAASEHPVISTPGVSKILGFGNKAAALDPEEVNAVHLAAKATGLTRPCPYLATGSTVRITQGPLAGLVGILANVKNSEVLVVSLSLLRRSIAVEIGTASVEQLTKAAAAGTSRSSFG